MTRRKLMADTRDYPDLLSRINDALLKKHDEHTTKAWKDGRIVNNEDWTIAGAYLNASKILCAMWMMPPEKKDKE